MQIVKPTARVPERTNVSSFVRTKWIIIGVVFTLLVIAARVLEIFLCRSKRVYEYARRDSLMTPAERECYHALVKEMGED